MLVWYLSVYTGGKQSYTQEPGLKIMTIGLWWKDFFPGVVEMEEVLCSEISDRQPMSLKSWSLLDEVEYRVGSRNGPDGGNQNKWEQILLCELLPKLH